MQQRPVLYLDLDDTVIAWSDGTPSGAPGVHEFLTWALDTFEVRLLSRWARTGIMEPRLVRDLARMSGVPPERLASIAGLDRDADALVRLHGILMDRFGDEQSAA